MKSALPVTIDGPLARVAFERYDLDAYRLFLRCKKLPEQQVEYDWERDTYTVTTPARFASLLSDVGALEVRDETPLAGHLFDYQAFILRTALAAQRFAVWCDTGLGKGPMQLEWCRQVRDRTNGRVLLCAPLGIIPQMFSEAERFYAGELQLERIATREDLAEWCKRPGPGIGITNHQKFIPGVLPELRYLAGFDLEESSLLKTGGGVTKWNLIKSARGIEYKLSATATPAPNEAMEYASQASFLEKMRSEGDVIWTFFQRDKTGDWRVKPHARDAFYRFMASWSIYMRDPSRFGFRDILADLPDPVIHEYKLPLTEQQRMLMYRLTDAKGGLFSDDRMGVKERIQLSQVAKGFLYEKGSGSKRWVEVDSEKPAFVADLVRQERTAGRQVLVWTTFDEEARILARLIEGDVAVLDGDMSDEARADVLERFRSGDVPVLISKPQLIGFGLNFQFCRAMVFSGFTDSFEQVYQAVRRCYRFGQTEPVHVHFPYIPELEGMVWTNVKRKETQFLSDVAACENAYRAAMAELYGVAA